MKLFLILLIIISSYTLISPSTFFISLVLLGLASFLTFKHYKTDKIFILILSIIFVLFLIIRNVNLETFQSENSFVGIVIKRKDSYLIVFDGIERFYVKTDDQNIDVLDIIKIDGNFSKYNGQPVLESGFDFKNYLSERGINRQIYINNIEKIFNFPFDSNSYKNSVLNQFESNNAKVLAKSLLFGEIDYNDNLIKELRISGSFFLFSLSGIHINGLYKLFESILSRFVEENKEKKITYIIFLPWFLINLFNIAFIRIFLNKTLKLILEQKNVEISELEFKSSIYLIILVFNKFALAEVSIQISATISFFLYLCNVYIYRKIKFIRKFISSLIVFMVLIPFNLALNNSFNVLNILINLLVLPLVKFIILFIFPSIFMFKLSFMEGILNLVYDSFSFINFHNLNINGDAFNQYILVLYFMIIIGIIYFGEVGNLKLKMINISALLLLQITYFVPFERLNSFEVSFINIGQGDSTLIRLKNETILIDTGGSVSNDLACENLIPFFRKNKIYQIDKVYISHYDVDHYYAINSLKKYFLVKDIIDYNNFYEYKTKEIEIKNLNIYDDLFIDENSKSLVLYANIYNRKFLFTGDAPKSIEKAIIKDNPGLDIDYLKVGHHGSNTSSIDEFIKKITPEEAIISCGINNKYGHPNKEVLNVLSKYKVKIRRTDLEGTIRYKFFT